MNHVQAIEQNIENLGRTGFFDKHSVASDVTELDAFPYLLIHESPLTDALFLLVSKSDKVTTT